MATSARVQRILAEVRALGEAETAQLEAELFADSDLTGVAWGEEVDRRAVRVRTTHAPGLRPDEVRALFAMDPAAARAQLAARLVHRT